MGVDLNPYMKGLAAMTVHPSVQNAQPTKPHIPPAPTEVVVINNDKSHTWEIVGSLFALLSIPVAVLVNPQWALYMMAWAIFCGVMR